MPGPSRSTSPQANAPARKATPSHAGATRSRERMGEEDGLPGARGTTGSLTLMSGLATGWAVFALAARAISSIFALRLGGTGGSFCAANASRYGSQIGRAHV